jgi:hypothetical protein
MVGSICTVFEIGQGDVSEGQEFHGLDALVIIKAVKELERKGKAKIFSGTGSNLGVKFF